MKLLIDKQIFKEQFLAFAAVLTAASFSDQGTPSHRLLYAPPPTTNLHPRASSTADKPRK